MECKICKICGEEKPLSEFYMQITKRKNGEQYNWYQTTCKECLRIRTAKWIADNPERYKVLAKRRDDSRILQFRERSKERRLAGKNKEWDQNNKDKMKEYQKRRSQHKKHNIKKKEWTSCKKYFNYECAYCGINEEEAKIKTNNALHKEHFDHNGSNGLDNCVPACKNCNSQKYTFKFEEWYNKDNPIFNIERYNKIIKWINGDYKNSIIIKTK